MEAIQSINLFITYVDKEGPFLKVWGQTEKNTSLQVEQFLQGATSQFDQGVGQLAVENLHVGNLVCAKYKDNKYYRARITNVGYIHDGLVEVSFLDYGNRDVVPCINIRNLQNFPTSFISIPPLAAGFIFAEAHCPGGGEWNEAVFDNISKELRYREVQCTLLTQATQYYLVKLFITGSDVGALLISRGLMQHISLQAQQAVLLSMSMQQRQIQPVVAPVHHMPSTEINTYKAASLEPGCQYPVYVSYVNDGPCHFSVQLKQSEEVLVILMNEINSMVLKPLEDVPIPGTICLARCDEDNNICRAVVTNEVDNQFKVFYVDFGNYEVVPLDALYQIPFKYVLPKVMAIRFALAGVEKSTVTIEMQCAFKQFVDNRLLHMKVLPAPTRTAISKCELLDPETRTSALDVVNRAALNAFPEPLSLTRGFSQTVKVSFVFSCSRFFVQLSSKENELLKLMLDLQATCQSNDAMDPAGVKVGLPCCALYEGDQQWYRCQVIEVYQDGNAKVRYIDYGNEELVSGLQLKMVDGEQLTVLRPQAIECCLNGYQNMEEDSERDNLLEELILEQQFTMKVVEMTGKKALVELIDASNYNVASLLLDKIASSKSQVSPMLTGNRTEHRKSFSQQNGVAREQFSRGDSRKSPRDNSAKPWNDRSNNDTSWRSDNKEFRTNDRNSNEPNDQSWRQNNRGFSRNNDNKFNNRDNRENNRNKNDWNNKESGNADTNTWSAAQTDDWKTPQNDGGYNNKNPNQNDFGRNKERFNNGSAPRAGGYKKKPDFKRDGSEISSSGSEKSFHKGPRTSSRNDRFPKKFDQPKNDDSWNVSSVSLQFDAAASTDTFLANDVVGTESKVLICWFHNPQHFYCQLFDVQDRFKKMMDDIQQAYKTRKPDLAVVGAPVIGLFPEDKVLYRAQVLEVVGAQYKVFYVDFGNVSTIAKVWPIEKKFMALPAQAICCSLNGVLPSKEAWGDADNYGKYFDKGSFVCKFLAKEEEKISVSLMSDNNDIQQLLVQDGLAISKESLEPSIEIPLLVGQQFRATLKSVNNLSDLIVALQCGLALSCTMHNLEEATESNQDILKEYLEKIIIVYVDNVINDKLEVTLYDTEGNKLSIISPDEGAFDTVEALCPLLILSSTLWGFVSHVNETSLCIQPSIYVNTIQYLLEQMFEYYEGVTQDSPIIPEEGMVYAVHSADSNWYRARVTSFDDEKAEVCYVDYGNSESVAFGELRELTQPFLEISTVCVLVAVTVPTENFAEKDVIANIYYGEAGWEGVVQEQTTTKVAEIPAVEPVTCTPEIIEEAVIPPEVVPEVTPEVTPETIKVPTAPIQGTQVTVSHIDSPSDFYLQFIESLDSVEQLQLNLQGQVLEMAVLETPTAGVLCAAPYLADQQWYRAQILDADDDITTVRFVDYGNTDVIDNKTTQIKTLPPSLLSLEVYATRCSLKIKPLEEEEWGSNAMKRFEELIDGEVISAEFVDQDEKTNYVELYADGSNIKEILVKENLALVNEPAVESKSTCFVSNFNSPSEFWIQLENCVDELEWIAEQLSCAENFPELEDSTPGTLCAALFPADDMWYRARILSNTVAGLELLFIDYGNSCISSNLRQLPEDLLVTAPLAQKCSLAKPAGCQNWTPQATDKLSEISADGQTIFTLRKISTGETSVVELLLAGEDVALMLLPITEDGYVKNVESLDCFDVQKAGEILPRKFKLQCPNGLVWNEESLQKFQEINKKGETLYQIEMVSDELVRLYLNGNDIRFDLGGDKTASLNASNASNTEEEEISVEKSDEIKPVEKEILEGKTDEIKPVEATIETEVDLDKNETNLEVEEKIVESQLVIEQSSGSDSQFCDNSNDDGGSISINVEEQGKVVDRILTPDSLLENPVDDSETQISTLLSELVELALSENEKINGSEQLAAISSEPKPEKKVSLEGDNKVLDEDKKLTSSRSSSRPGSAGSGKIKHDDRILPATLSRPQTPLTSEDDDQELVTK